MTGPADDNIDSCETNVYRADVFVIKHITNTVRDEIVCECLAHFNANVTNELCVQDITETPTSSGTVYNVCRGSDAGTAYSGNGARFLASLTPGALASDTVACAPESECVRVVTAPWTSRLLDIGVWNCQGGTGGAPVGQWIQLLEVHRDPGRWRLSGCTSPVTTTSSYGSTASLSTLRRAP